MASSFSEIKQIRISLRQTEIALDAAAYYKTYKGHIEVRTTVITNVVCFIRWQYLLYR